MKIREYTNHSRHAGARRAILKQLRRHRMFRGMSLRCRATSRRVVSRRATSRRVARRRATVEKYSFFYSKIVCDVTSHRVASRTSIRRVARRFHALNLRNSLKAKREFAGASQPAFTTKLFGFPHLQHLHCCFSSYEFARGSFELSPPRMHAFSFCFADDLGQRLEHPATCPQLSQCHCPTFCEAAWHAWRHLHWVVFWILPRRARNNSNKKLKPHLLANVRWRHFVPIGDVLSFCRGDKKDIWRHVDKDG